MKVKTMFSFRAKSCTFPQCRPRSKSKSRLRKHRAVATSEVHEAPHKRSKSTGKQVPKVRIAGVLTVLFSLRKLPKEVQVDADVTCEENKEEVISKPEVVTRETTKEAAEMAHVKSGHVRDETGSYKECYDDFEEVGVGVGDLCEFERYLVEMVGEDGKLMDLKDVEELLYCWKNVTSPVFVDLVCRFYGEVCKDLLSITKDDENNVTTPSE